MCVPNNKKRHTQDSKDGHRIHKKNGTNCTNRKVWFPELPQKKRSSHKEWDPRIPTFLVEILWDEELKPNSNARRPSVVRNLILLSDIFNSWWNPGSWCDLQNLRISGGPPHTRRESSKNGNHILKKTVVFFFPWGQPPLSPTCSPRQHPHCPLAPSQVLASQLVHSSKIQSTASSQSSQTPPIQPPSVKPKKAWEVFLGYPPSLKNQMWPTSCSGFQFQPKDLKPSNKAFL